jgi:tRNA uridine 5-carbamoylmethylation protein Kti12
MKHEMGVETVEDENMWTTNEGEKFTKEILEKFLQRLQTSQYRWNEGLLREP